ncbi:uncharacterized protein BO96DRAFT_491078 [Aspergillus niger CBS 101883]|uniref:uncharacterized protein n=1 Tax=Aspergillus lacticoffeatus (strain CBS 101883) TaxID=1450533 RepID=UPI000D7FC737|nr:uncharacterized protein BO96DRAFT_491078 [Aspergillus niger CBS 101883]PYH58933.1 hypothetical protein BO96DRAFT_491078 [Aspergillus niger CBS 101883]
MTSMNFSKQNRMGKQDALGLKAIARLDQQTLEAQLTALKLPISHIPWAGEITAYGPLVEASMLQWADNDGLMIDNVAYRERVKRMDPWVYGMGGTGYSAIWG